jgi:glycerol transport system substrate-binding protein
LAQEKILSRIERAGIQGDIGPKLNEKKTAEYWLKQPGAPKPKLANEKPAPVTISYDELIKSWK